MEGAVRLLPAVAAILALSSVDVLAQSDLPRSGQCRFGGGGFAYAGGIALPDTIIMKNDGGWCGSLVRTVLSSIVVGAPMHVTNRPAHGQVSITVLSNGTNVYYKPDPGYVGSDSFAVLHEMYNIERVYNVVVR
jgi:hypothetical protein